MISMQPNIDTVSVQYLTSVINKDLKPVFVVRWRENAAERLYNAKTVYKAKAVEVDN